MLSPCPCEGLGEGLASGARWVRRIRPCAKQAALVAMRSAATALGEDEVGLLARAVKLSGAIRNGC